MHVLVATDGSPRSMAAADFLRRLLPPHGVERITVLAVVNDYLNVEPMTMGASNYETNFYYWQLARDAEEQSAETAVNRIVERISDCAAQVRTLVREGMPSQEIVDVADEIDADLIVVGTHDHGALRAALLGDVSEQVLHRSHRAILIVPQASDRSQQQSSHQQARSMEANG